MKLKKTLPLILALLMAGGVFAAGCSNNGNTGDGGDKGDGDKTEQGSGDKTDGDKTEGEGGGGSTGTDTSTALPAGKKIYLVGDSTVCSFNDPYFLPRYGYGTQVVEYFNATSDQIVNLALSGRSSKDFLTEGNYSTLKSSIAEGDYLIIGFGHNDEKSDDSTRFTNPKGDKNTAGSFQKSLYDNYVKLAVDKGATPILCTPITRYDSNNSYSGSKVHNTSDGDYVQAIKDLGEDTDTTVVDLTALTVAEYKKDNAAAAYYHAHTTRKGDAGATTGTEEPDGRDDTHLNKFGAKMVAYQLANALKDTDNSIKAHVKTNITAPTKDKDYADAVNLSYVKPDYKGFDPDNTTATKLNDAGWYATAMGNIGDSADKISSLTATYESGKFTVGDTGDKRASKFESKSDGFGAAFLQIAANKNFKATVTATVKSVSSSLGDTEKQAGFGMMLRDDILINTHEATLNSNYVAGGVLHNVANIFSRFSQATSIANNKKISDSSVGVSAGNSHTITIERAGQIITVTVDEQSVVFKEDMMDVFARDNDYMYLCLFANRGIVAEFTNLSFEITGTYGGA